MSSEAEWIESIKNRVHGIGPGRFAQRADLENVELALSEHPESVKLWILRGDLIQLLDDDPTDRWPLREALSSYQRALALAPGDAEAQAEMGFYYDTIEDSPTTAEPFLRHAVEQGAPPVVWAGLARVLAELGRAQEALGLIAEQNCPHASSDEVKAIRDEITEGLWHKPNAAG